MTKYLSDTRIRLAVENLRSSRAAGGFVNFLILKRAIQLDPDSTVKLSKNDKPFQQAIDELTLWSDAENSPRPFIDVFGSINARNNGTKLKKYRSNGPADTYKGSWNQIVEIRDGDPSKIAILLDNYLDGIKERTVLKDATRSMPKIADAAVWYFRREAIDKFIGRTNSQLSIESELVDTFSKRLALTQPEIAILFASKDSDAQ
ncbi:hypothetical protein N9Y42_01830 [Mariniblastus sp.]|nr:hypothetical protein [Mariniblastus sp.]